MRIKQAPPKDFPKRLAAFRQQQRISQEGLAHLLRVSWASVSRWERGETQPSPLAVHAFEVLEQQAKEQKRGRK